MEPSGTVSGTDAFILLQIKMSIVGAISDRHRPTGKSLLTSSWDLQAYSDFMFDRLSRESSLTQKLS